MKRIGIMGGTFNPIHNGHLAIAGQAKEQFLLDKVLFMPSGVSYMKNQQEILPACVRCEMTALAIRDIPGFELSDMEAAEDTNTYTSHTLQKLKALHPETNYYFILGADSLYALETWRCPELIFQNCTILAAVRKRQDFTDLSMQDMKEQLLAHSQYLRQKYHAFVEILDIDSIDVSSSRIRGLLQRKETIHGLVPGAVEEYIIKNQLYQS